MVAFTLTMLGTDTKYSPDLKEKNAKKEGDYPKGETLSIISSHIETSKNPVINPKEADPYTKPNSYSAPEVQVINGPKTEGTYVNDRIARGVAALLKAIARGQKPLNIISHSRGAVEAILIAHELEAVQNLLSQCNNLSELISGLKNLQANRKKEDPKNNTGDIIAVLTQELNDVAKDAAFFEALKNNTKEASLNLFAIDPVPGDGILWVTWNDQRFYKIPAIVKNAEFVYYENERSDLGFTPLFPIATSKEHQNVSYITVPGHHGTGSAGNNRCQRGVLVDQLAIKQAQKEKGKTTHVQKLLIFKLFDFLTRGGVKFNELSLFGEGRGLGRTLFAEAKPQLPSDYRSIYRKLYAKIFENRHAYNLFNKTSYLLMGVLKARQVFHNGSKKNLHDHFTLGTTYINDEHAQLMREYFQEKFKLDAENASLNQIIESITKQLLATIQQLGPEPAAANSAALPSNLALNQSYVAPPKLLKDPTVRQDFLNVFDLIVARVSEMYLNHDWSSPAKQEEKLQTFASFTLMVNQLKESLNSANPDVSSFAKELLILINKGMHITVSQQFDHYNNELNWLINIPQDPLKSYINELVLNLKGVVDKSQEDETVKAIFQDPAFIRLSDSPLSSKMDFIWKELDKQLNNDKFKAEFSAERLEREFTERFNQDFKTYQTLYNKIQFFIADAKALTRLNDQLKAPFALLESELNSKLPQLIDVAARRFYANKSITERETLLRDDFQGQVERCAILKHGAQDPMVVLQTRFQLLEREKQQLTQELTQFKAREALLLGEKKQLEGTQKQLLSNQADLLVIITGLKAAQEQTQSDINALRLALADKQDQLHNLKTNHQVLSTKQADTEQQLQQAVAREARLNNDKDSLNNDRAALTTALQQSKDRVADLHAQLAQTRNQYNAEKDALNQRIATLEQQLTDAESANEQSQNQVSRLVEKLMRWINKAQTQKTTYEAQIDGLLQEKLSLEQLLRIELNALHNKRNEALANVLAAEQRVYKEVVNNRQAQDMVNALDAKERALVVQRNTLAKEKRELKDELAQTKVQVATMQEEYAAAQQYITFLTKQVDEKNHYSIDLVQQYLRAKENYQETLQQLNASALREQTLQQECAQLAQGQADLTRALNEKQTAMTAVERELQQVRSTLTDKLNDTNEAKSLILIQEKLIPLTKKYVDYLTPSTVDNTEEGVKALNKMNKLKRLLEDLEQPNVFASVRVKNFYTRLNEYELELGEHRDLMWKRYCKNTLLVGLTLITGILPGLIALMIYVNTGDTTGKSMRFWQSRGETYLQEMRDEIEPVTPHIGG